MWTLWIAVKYQCFMCPQLTINNLYIILLNINILYNHKRGCFIHKVHKVTFFVDFVTTLWTVILMIINVLTPFHEVHKVFLYTYKYLRQGGEKRPCFFPPCRPPLFVQMYIQPYGHMAVFNGF